MTDWQPDDSPPPASRFSVRAFVVAEWPYLLMLALAIFGVSYTSFSQTPIRGYWIALCPIVGLICILTGWRHAATQDQRWRLVWTQALHWGAVFLAIELLFVADVARMMNADANALSTLTLLALGAFTAGLHVRSWRICVVGVLLALGVPGIAWLEQSALFILLVVIAAVGVAAPILLRRQRSKKAGADDDLWNDD